MRCSVLAIFAAAGLVSALPAATGTTDSAPSTTSGSPAGSTCSPGPVVAYTVVSGDTLTIGLQSGAPTSNLLVWITALGQSDGQYSSQIAEVTVIGGS